ncbi:hypothetical protein ACFYWS_26035 [Streptomyces sp. NPDC002795]|uniref:hypothetical protein n=1 Tax=Streptomyces sp. NPDC002795 TaxID=3364665 RepID=UPI00367A6452
MVNGRVVKYDGTLLGERLAAARTATTATVEHFRSAMGEEEWRQVWEPQLPAAERTPNPYLDEVWD